VYEGVLCGVCAGRGGRRVVGREAEVLLPLAGGELVDSVGRGRVDTDQHVPQVSEQVSMAIRLSVIPLTNSFSSFGNAATPTNER